MNQTTNSQTVPTMLFMQMQNIVNRYVKHYKEDFESDKEIILQMLDSNYDIMKYERYLFWIVRTCGTNIGYKSNAKTSPIYFYYLIEDKENRYYEIDLENQTVKHIANPEKYMKAA